MNNAEVKIKQPPEASDENVARALNAVASMASRRKLSYEPGHAGAPLGFPSRRAEKRFRWRMLRATDRPTMATANAFLGDLARLTGAGRGRVDYSPEEKSIRAARKRWRELQKQCEDARREYRLVKGDFYR